MSPAETAAAMHTDGQPDFSAAVAGHFLDGLVISTPRLFLLARPVRSDCPGTWCDLLASHENPDAWYVWTAVGNLREILAIAAPLLDGKFLLAFHRRGSPRMVQFHRLHENAQQ